jgi:hypothetical protein
VEDMIRRFHSALPQIRAWIDQYLESNAATARRLDSMPPLRTAFPPEVLARARMVLVSQTPFPPVSQFGLPQLSMDMRERTPKVGSGVYGPWARSLVRDI